MLIMSQAILDDIFQSCWVFFHVLILVKYQIFCWVLLRLTIRIWFSWNGKLDKTDRHLLTADGDEIFISTITLTMDVLILANYPVHLFRALSLWEAAATSLVILITITVKLFHSHPFPPENNWLAHFSAKRTRMVQSAFIYSLKTHSLNHGHWALHASPAFQAASQGRQMHKEIVTIQHSKYMEYPGSLKERLPTLTAGAWLNVLITATGD